MKAKIREQRIPGVEKEQAKKYPVLLAEDDPVSLRLLEKKLKDWGYRVFKARNGKKAWELLKTARVRIAILDWMMPALEGPELCSRLRQIRKPHYTYLILLTARNTSLDIVQGLEAGADDYMTKPINLMELQARLKAAHRIIELEENLLKTQKKLQKLATTDSLTGAWNRRTVLEFLREELNRYRRGGPPFGLLMIDLDHFKNINDQYGHQAGDIVLKQLVQLIKINLRNYDRVGRYGGDELLILLPGSDVYHTGLVAARLLSLAKETKIRINQRLQLGLTMSIGGTSADSISKPKPETIVQTADRALYLAKKLGRYRVILFGDSVKLPVEEEDHG